jgi:hypothetical protein
MYLANQHGMGAVDPANLIPSGGGLYTDALGGGTYYLDPLTNNYERWVGANVVNVVAPRPAVVVTSTGPGMVTTKPNPAAGPTQGGNSPVLIPQNVLSRTAGNWANSLSVWPTVQNQLGLNNLSFAVVASMVGLTLLITMTGTGYAARRYGR